MKTNTDKFREFLNSIIEVNEVEANSANGPWKIAMDGKVTTLHRIADTFNYYFPVEVPSEPVSHS